MEKIYPSGQNSARAVICIALIYLLSSCVTGPLGSEAASGKWHWRFGPIYLGRPIVTSGDSPHYLLIVNSLLEDLDLDLANNHRQVSEGDWDAGARVRGTSFGGHVETDTEGRKLSFYPFFRPAILAFLVWPWQGTEWVESICIWLTMSVVLLGFIWFRRAVGRETTWLLLLALATPLWYYSGDLWSESWMAVAWILLLTSTNSWVLAASSFLGTLIKFPFCLVPFTLAGLALRRGDLRRSIFLAGATAAALALAVLAIQWIYQDADHFSLFHIGLRHLSDTGSFDFPGLRFFRAGIGLLLDPRRGLLWFAPFLIWGFPQFRRGGDWYLPALVFFLFHAAYPGWHGGAGYSARYLVPMLPVMVKAVAETRPSGRLFTGCVLYSLFWGALAGVLPIAVFDKTPWETLSFLMVEVRVWIG